MHALLMMRIVELHKECRFITRQEPIDGIGEIYSYVCIFIFFASYKLQVTENNNAIKSTAWICLFVSVAELTTNF